MFDPPGDGTYTVYLYGACDGDDCRSCTVTLNVQEQVECQCEGWRDVQVSWPGHSPIRVICGTKTPVPITISSSDKITITSSVTCNDPSCKKSYRWNVVGTRIQGTGLPAVFDPPGDGTYTVYLYGACDGDDCRSCSVTLNVQEQEECKCKGWQWINVGWDGNSESVECDETVDIKTTCGSEIYVKGDFLCDPPGPDCTATIDWEITSVSSGLVAQGTGGSPIGFGFTPVHTSGWDTYTVELMPECDGEDCGTCTFRFRVKVVCECGEWEGITVSSVDGDWEQSVECFGETIFAPPGVYAVTVIADYSCDPPECPPTYQWEVTYPDSGETMSGTCDSDPCEFSFKIPECAEVCITPICCETECEECCFEICPECDCGDWGDADNNGISDVTVEGDIVNIEETITVTAADLPITIEPGYQCQGECGPVIYEWGVGWPDGGGAQGFTSAPIELTQSELDGGPGIYEVVLIPYCDGQECEEIPFDILIETTPCECGDWGDVEVSWTDASGNAQSWIGSCGDTHPGIFDLSGPITVNSGIGCSQGCSPDYTWEVTTYSGMTLPSPSSGSGLPAQFTPQGSGWNSYVVHLNASCDGVECQPCTIYMRVHVPEQECRCPDCPEGTEVMLVGSNPVTTPGAVVVSPVPPGWTDLPLNPGCEAQWVWDNAGGDPDPSGESNQFVTEFEIPEGYCVVEACLEISADDGAEVSLNGTPVGTHGDTNDYPPNAPSGFDEVSAIVIDPDLFYDCDSGVLNQLQVTVTDVHGYYAGGIWCLQLCLGECECGDWADGEIGVTWPGGGPGSVSCGDTIYAPLHVGVVEVTASIPCGPWECCDLTYEWEVTCSDTGEVGEVIAGGTCDSDPCEFTFELPEGGAEVCITPICCGIECEECCFEICPECDCGEWGDVEVSWTDASGNAQSWIGSCGDTHPGIFDLSGPITVNSGIGCSQGCSPDYTWEVTTYSGMTLPSPSSGSGLPAQFTPQGSGWNSYVVHLNASCDGVECQPCAIYMRVHVPEQECQCGEWGNADNNNDPDVIVEGVIVNIDETITLTAADLPVTIEPGYQCQGECGPVTYDWQVFGPGGISGSAESVTAPIDLTQSELDGGVPGNYNVWLWPYCDGQECVKLLFHLVIETTECDIDSMVVPSNISNTEFCDGDPAVEVTNPPGAWTAELETECGAQWLWDNVDGLLGPVYPHDCYTSDSLCMTFEIPQGCEVGSAVLKIGADDEAPSIKLNGASIGSHSGYGSVGSFSIAPNLFVLGTNTLEVEVKDTDCAHQGGTWCLTIYFQ